MNLTITPNLFNFKRQTNTPLINNNYSNLKPLERDTVSFGVGAKQLKNKARLSKQMGMDVNKTLAKAFQMFQKKLESAFNSMKASDSYPDRPIYKIKARIKSPESIAEKGGAREIKNLAELSHQIQDIIGGRLILRDTSRQSIEAILKKLEEMVLKGELSIVEIENFYGDPRLSYVTSKQLQPLKKACEKMVGHIRVVSEEHDMGYSAIHLTVKFPPTKYGESYAEIQIMGADIAELKDVEDLTYKIRCGKPIQKKYMSMMKYLKPLQEEGNDVLKNAFKEYTRNAYLHQRKRKNVTLKELQNRTEPDFLPLPWIIPNRELDFNFLYKKMKECEEIAAKAAKDAKNSGATKVSKASRTSRNKNSEAAGKEAGNKKIENKAKAEGNIVNNGTNNLLENMDEII